MFIYRKSATLPKNRDRVDSNSKYDTKRWFPLGRVVYVWHRSRQQSRDCTCHKYIWQPMDRDHIWEHDWVNRCHYVCSIIRRQMRCAPHEVRSTAQHVGLWYPCNRKCRRDFGRYWSCWNPLFGFRLNEEPPYLLFGEPIVLNVSSCWFRRGRTAHPHTINSKHSKTTDKEIK